MSNIMVLPHEVYYTQMVEAKLRLLAIEKILNAVMPISGLVAFDSEFCFLHIRKIIELITFSAISREKSRYKKLRKQDHQANPKDHGNAAKDWQSPNILKRLMSLSPYVLPIPITHAIQTGSNTFHFERHTMSVTHSRLIELYKMCSSYMHSKNPLDTDYVVQVEMERAKYQVAPVEIRRAQEFLRKLLWQHAVVQLDWTDRENPKAIDDPKSAWLLDFETLVDEQIILIVGEAI